MFVVCGCVDEYFDMSFCVYFRQYQLQREVVVEGEKVMQNLVCSSLDLDIRTKFIEACITNLKHHVYVIFLSHIA